jgi:hypothetical protein
MEHLFSEIARRLAALFGEDNDADREAYLEELTDEQLETFVSESSQVARSVAAAPAEFVTEDRTAAQVLAEMREGVAAIQIARDELAARADDPTDPEPEELSAEALAEIAELANVADEPEDDPEADAADPDEEPDPEAAAAEPAAAVIEEPAAVVAAAPARRRSSAPARSRAAAPQPTPPRIALTAAAGAVGVQIGTEMGELEIARSMMARHGQIGQGGGGGFEKFPIARASWIDLFPEDRRLREGAIAQNTAIIAAATDQRTFKAEIERREESAVTASGALCAPVAPYYALQQVSQAARPVRDALVTFGADRGGINAAAPASLTDVIGGDAVGRIEEDATGSAATKTCQIIDCPDFDEVMVAAIYHCVQFGNLGARAFPELVAQWNALVLAAHARTAEGALLDGISAASTAVTADNLGLGASATIPSQIITAAVGMRSRHRMDPETVLRVLLPFWVLELLVSDMYRTQFQRFDMTREQFVATLRAANVEPSFYLDEAAGSGQIFGAQAGGALDAFPSTVVWYMFPEGSFLYLDAGTLELGLVRDSVLNADNNFQIFGETWENVAFVGVESLEVTTTVCDSGTVSLPDAVACPTNYAA